MYLMQTIEGEKAATTAATVRPPFGPGFDPSQVAGVQKLEIHGSSFADPGADFCEYVLIGDGGRELARKRMEGY